MWYHRKLSIVLCMKKYPLFWPAKKICKTRKFSVSWPAKDSVTVKTQEYFFLMRICVNTVVVISLKFVIFVHKIVCLCIYTSLYGKCSEGFEHISLSILN